MEQKIKICNECGRKILTEYIECPWCIGPNLINNYLKRELMLTQELDRLLKVLDDINDPIPETRLIFINKSKYNYLTIIIVDPIRMIITRKKTNSIYEPSKIIIDCIIDTIQNENNPNLCLIYSGFGFLTGTDIFDTISCDLRRRGFEKIVTEVIRDV